MFSKAKVVTRPSVAPTGKKPAKVTETIDGLADVCALEACLKAIEGLLKVKKDAVKAVAQERLIANGLARHAKPDSLALAEGPHAQGNVAVVKRSTRSPVTADEVEMLETLAGETVGDLIETVDEQPEMLAVNPAYAGNEALLKKIDRALAGVKGIPDDFVIMVPATTKTVVRDTATDAVFRLAPEVASQVFPLVASTMMRATFGDMTAAWDVVRPMIAPSEAEVKIALRASLRASVEQAE